MRAKQAVQNWDHFRLGWAEVNEPPVKVGAKVCVVAKCLLLWVLNPLEIVYVREGSTNLPAPSIPGNTSIPRNVKGEYCVAGIQQYPDFGVYVDKQLMVVTAA